MNRFVLLAAAAVLTALPVNAQMSVPPGQGTAFHDTSMLKLPAGAKAAIFEFEDLECPACGHDSPIVRAAIEKYKIPYLRHDFPLPMHRWSKDAAITARYLQDKVDKNPAGPGVVAEQFRRDVFAAQTSINSKDDLNNFTAKWFANHHLTMPFVMDGSGLFTAEVNADYTLGQRLGVAETPTILVLSERGWIQIKDITQLYSTLDSVIAQASASKPVVHSNLKKPVTAQK